MTAVLIAASVPFLTAVFVLVVANAACMPVVVLIPKGQGVIGNLSCSSL
jgi:hypothetical protein